MITNYYECEECTYEWTMEWDAECDDKCHNCHTAYSPYKSIHVEGEANGR